MHGMANIGNMGEVYRAARVQAEREINEVVSHMAGMEAEISEGAQADWYLVNTFPGDDVKAMRWLARRRFGVFRPMQQRRFGQFEGQQIGVMEPVFPGHLFVYVWDINKMRSRILACPGVSGLLCTVGGQPIGVNQPDKHGVFFIDKLRGLSWVYSERLGHVGHEAQRQQRTPKIGKKERKALRSLKMSLKTLGKFDPSTWAKAAELAPVKRIALLMQVLQGPAAEGGAQLSA